MKRGFCKNCGTPLTFEPEGGGIDIAIGAFDEAHKITPEIQLAREARLPSFDRLYALPLLNDADGRIAARFARITSNQHPDHDT